MAAPTASISFPQTHADYFDNPSNANAMLSAITTIVKTSAERPQQKAASQQAIQSAASKCAGDQIEKMINAGFSKEEIMRLCETTTESPAKGTLPKEEAAAPVPEAQSQIMTLDELNAFAAQQAKVYKVTINGMDPNQGLEYKKFLRSPGDFLGRIVLMRGYMDAARRVFSFFLTSSSSILYQYAFVSLKPEQKAFHLLGLTPQSPVHNLRADDFLLIGAVAPGAQIASQATASAGLGYRTDAGINIYSEFTPCHHNANYYAAL